MGSPGSKRKPFPLIDHVDDLLSALHDAAPLALEKFDADAVHDARVATRRLTAALDLLEPVLSKRHRKPMATGLKKLRRRLGGLRDADVMLDHLAQVAKVPRHSSAIHWLTDCAEQERDRLRKESSEKASADQLLKQIDIWPLVRREIEEARQAVDCLLAESLHQQTSLFAEQADRLCDGGTAMSVAVAVNPHDLRIAGKALRYTLEMAAVEGHDVGKRLMKAFKRMQEHLGIWHDLVVLADSALGQIVGKELTHFEPATSEEVLDFSKRVIQQSKRELAAFCRLWKRQGAQLAARIRKAFPLIQDGTFPTTAEGVVPVIESQMDHGLFEITIPPVLADAESASSPGV